MRSLLSCGVIVAWVLTGGTALAEPLGLWRDSDGTAIRVQRCGSALCHDRNAAPATIPNRQLDRQARRPDQARGPLIGRQVFIDMQPAGAGKWSGTLYNTDDGRSLRGDLIERGPNLLRVEGCVGTRCGGENLHRAGR